MSDNDFSDEEIENVLFNFEFIVMGLIRDDPDLDTMKVALELRDHKTEGVSYPADENDMVRVGLSGTTVLDTLGWVPWRVLSAPPPKEQR